MAANTHLDGHLPGSSAVEERLEDCATELALIEQSLIGLHALPTRLDHWAGVALGQLLSAALEHGYLTGGVDPALAEAIARDAWTFARAMERTRPATSTSGEGEL